MTLKAQLREDWSEKEVNLKQMKTPSGEVTCAYTAVANDVLPKEVFPRTSGHAHDDAYLTSYLGRYTCTCTLLCNGHHDITGLV